MCPLERIVAEGGEWCFTLEGSVASSPESKLEAPKLRMLAQGTFRLEATAGDEGSGKGTVPKSSRTCGFCVLPVCRYDERLAIRYSIVEQVIKKMSDAKDVHWGLKV